jgi:hypothetical protein
MTIYNIDVAHDPSKAIKEISDPIMTLLNVKIEAY